MAKIRVLNVIQTRERAPSRWQGMTDTGMLIYVRYRWGCLSIGLGATLDEAVRNQYIEKQLGHRLDGTLEYSKLRDATKDVIEWPEDFPRGKSQFQTKS